MSYLQTTLGQEVSEKTVHLTATCGSTHTACNERLLFNV